MVNGNIITEMGYKVCKNDIILVDGKEIASGTFTLGKSDTRNQQSVSFSISSDKVVTVSVSKTSGADPVLSWVSILKQN